MIPKLAPLLVTLGMFGTVSLAHADERTIIPSRATVVQHRAGRGADRTYRSYERVQRPVRVRTYDRRHDRRVTVWPRYRRPTHVRTYSYQWPHRYGWSRYAPPVVRFERVRQRPGYVWVNGRYDWRYDRYVWVPGHFVANQPSRVYVQGRWSLRDGFYVWIDGFWQDRPAYAAATQVWVDGRTEWRNGVSVWVPGHYTTIYR